MALVRCTCVYRASTTAERDAGKAAISVAARDPWCPAAALHDRAAPAGRAVAPLPTTTGGAEPSS